MPSETIRAIEFIRSTSDGKIRKIRDAQLRAAEELVRSRALSQTKWNACIPGSISASAGNFQTVAAKQLLRHLNVGGAAWIGQFAYGFPIDGKLSHVFASRVGGNPLTASLYRAFSILPMPVFGSEPPNLAWRMPIRCGLRPWGK